VSEAQPLSRPAKSAGTGGVRGRGQIGGVVNGALVDAPGGQRRPCRSPAPWEFPVGRLSAKCRTLHFPAEPEAGWNKLNPEWRAVWADLVKAQEEHEMAEYDRFLAEAPSWWADLEFVNNLALGFLDAVVAKLGYDLVCGAWEPGQVRWWPWHEPGWVLAVAERGTNEPMVYIDRASGWWVVGQWERQGPSLVKLVEWRWGLSQTKAAWRLAKLCGRRRPVR
jgi:hypothetical protein